MNNIYLSDAIRKRDRLEKEATEMDTWILKQEFETKELKWCDMRKAVKEVADKRWEEWHRYNDAIEKDIQQLEIEISK